LFIFANAHPLAPSLELYINPEALVPESCGSLGLEAVSCFSSFLPPVRARP